MTDHTRLVLLYDGHCRLCVGGVHKLLRLIGQRTVEPADFQQPGVLDRFPGVTYEACLKGMQLVTPAGRVYSGAEAAIHLLATQPLLGWLASVYYMPGVRQLCDRLYAVLATHRYRLLGKTNAAECGEGTCHAHYRPVRGRFVR